MTTTTREVACLPWDLVPVVRHEALRGNTLVGHDPAVPLSLHLATTSGPLRLAHRIDVESLRAHFLRPACLVLDGADGAHGAHGAVLRCTVSGLELRGGDGEAPRPAPAWQGDRLVLSTRVEQLVRRERDVVCTVADFAEVVAGERERGNDGAVTRRDPHYPATWELQRRPDTDAIRLEFDLPSCVGVVVPSRRRCSVGCSRAYVGVAGEGREAPGAGEWRRALDQAAPPRRVLAARHGDLDGDRATTDWRHERVRAGALDLLVRIAADDPWEVEHLHRAGAWVPAGALVAVTLPARGPVEREPLDPAAARWLATTWHEDGRLQQVPDDL